MLSVTAVLSTAVMGSLRSAALTMRMWETCSRKYTLTHTLTNVKFLCKVM